jgi:hypothetical protein
MATDYTIRLEQLQARLSSLLDTWYYMKEYAEPELWRRYQILFGDLEKKLAEKETEIHRIEFLIENKGVRFDTERLLDIVLKESGVTLYGSDNAYVSEEEVRWGKAEAVYRVLIMQVHPDVCTDNKLSRRYWPQIKDAYKKKDVERLSSYLDIINGINDREILNSIIKLEKRVCDYEEKIFRLKAREPFIYEGQYGNSLWIEDKRRSLLNQILLADIRISQKQRILDFYSSRKVS